ncbi:MAG: cupin domain-containing protein [Blautia marasmi]
MVQFRKLDMDGRKKEKIVFQNQMLHYGLYVPRPEAYFFGDIPWHWHDEFEFGHILGGSMQYKTNHHEFILHEGDGIFINSGVLHYLHPLKPVEDVRLQSQFFDRSFLAGASGSILDIKYIAPVLEQRQLDAVPLYCSEAGSAKFLEKMREGAELSIKGERFLSCASEAFFGTLGDCVFLGHG